LAPTTGFGPDEEKPAIEGNGVGGKRKASSKRPSTPVSVAQEGRLRLKKDHYPS